MDCGIFQTKPRQKDIISKACFKRVFRDTRPSRGTNYSRDTIILETLDKNMLEIGRQLETIIIAGYG
jgi:hypothetical protein